MIPPEDWLMLSGIQHFLFCPRQWGLIDIEQSWADNKLTIEGSILHENVDNPLYRLCNSGRLTLRRVALASAEMGVSGFSDAIELIPTPKDGISVAGYSGKWIPYPIEYKHGKGKTGHCDEAQLAAQVMCLEEMYGISLTEGAIFYAKTKRRTTVTITEELRSLTKKSFHQMHELIRSGKIPKATPSPNCKKCSLTDICMPHSGYNGTVAKYLIKNLHEDTP